MTPSPADPRPSAVTAAFWCWLAGAALLIVGGVFTVAVPVPAIFRGIGLLGALAGALLALAAGRTRDGDPRARRAAIALSLAIVVVVAADAVFGGVVNVLTLVALLPLIAGTVTVRTPAAQAWFDAAQARFDREAR